MTLPRWAELAPSATEAHPDSGAAHLMPLMVVAGAALGGAGFVFGEGRTAAVVSANDPMGAFAQSQFEFRDRFQVRVRVRANTSPFQRFNQPVLAKVSVQLSNRVDCVWR